MPLDDMETRLLKLELELLISNLHVEQAEAKLNVYEGLLKSLPSLITVLGMADDDERERALQLLTTLVNSFEQFQRDIGEAEDDE